MKIHTLQKLLLQQLYNKQNAKEHFKTVCSRVSE